MARIALGVLSLVLLIGFSGCTWTETYAEYPPRLTPGQHAHNHAHHAHDPVHD